MNLLDILSSFFYLILKHYIVHNFAGLKGATVSCQNQNYLFPDVTSNIEPYLEQSHKAVQNTRHIGNTTIFQLKTSVNWGNKYAFYHHF